jgi:hypothetical protein
MIGPAAGPGGPLSRAVFSRPVRLFCGGPP